MKSRGGCIRVLVLLVLFSSGRALAQADDAALPPAPPPPPSPSPSASASPPAQEAPELAPGVASAALTPAVAAPPSSDAPARSGLDDPERNWYGWQLLINDFVALGTLGVAATAGLKGSDAIAVIVPVALVYDLGGPTIHWLHGRRGIAAASFGVRNGVPLVGVLVGVVVGSLCNHEQVGPSGCRSQAAGYGALAGFAAASAIDATFLAFDAPPVEKRAASGFRWAPLVTPAEGGATLGVVGTF